jgi:hypothetical protein
MSGADEFFPDTGPTSPSGATRRRFLPTATANGEKLSATPTPGMAKHYQTHRANLLEWVANEIYGGLISSAADSPASPSPSPADAEDRTTNAGSGPSSPESFAYYDPDSSSWRTFQVSLLEEWATFSGTWPRAGMTRNGTAYRLPPSVPLTSVTGSSSLGFKPTHHVPTPTASDHIERKSTSSEVLNPETNKSVSLDRWVRYWPTPKGSPEHYGQPRENDWGDLQAATGGGQLNPTWVEWLMGFPAGWSDLGDSETPSSPRSPSG